MRTNQQVDQQPYLQGIRDRDPLVLKEIYLRFFPMIANHVQKNGGTEADARDVFQDTILVLFRKMQAPDFELTSSFSTYLFAVGKHIWLKQISRKRKNPSLSIEKVNLPDEESVEKALLITERNQLFRQKMKLLSEGCQRLLTLFFEGMSMANIAEQLGFASEGYAKKRKFQCKQKLTELIKADPKFSEMSH
ncbi:MAG: sigma-70 family RNA polymerase sigma factor [Bacteroidota bacterium]